MSMMVCYGMKKYFLWNVPILMKVKEYDKSFTKSQPSFNFLQKEMI